MLRRHSTRGAGATAWTIVLGVLVLLLAAGLLFQMTEEPRSPGIPPALETAGTARGGDTPIQDPATGLLIAPTGELLDRDFTERSGDDVTTGQLEGRISVVSLIFTNCPSICAAMTEQMARLQSDLKRAPDVQLVSLTVDPARDTPEVLEAYADRFGADSDLWWFLRGDVEDVMDVALGGIRLDGDRENPLFHSEHLALIDHDGRVRGFYQPLRDSAWRTKINAAIAVLREEDANRTDLLPEPEGEFFDFPTIDHLGNEHRTHDHLGKALVVNYVFTKCNGTCPMLTKKMAELQEALADRDDVALLTFTVDPKRDSPEVLGEYAAEHGADPDRWRFLFLNEGQVLQMAHDGMGIGSAVRAIFHADYFMLLDRDGRVRAKYAPLDDDRWIEKLERALDVLAAESDDGSTGRAE